MIYEFQTKAASDNTTNVVKPQLDKIYIKKTKDTPTRQREETEKYKAREERNKRIINKFSKTPAGRRATNRAYAIESQKAKQEAAKEEAAAVIQSILGPAMPSYWLNILSATKEGKVNNVTDALAAPYLSDSWSMKNPGKALVLDVASPFIVSKGISNANRIARNVANRRYFTYEYLNPFGYDHLIKRYGKVVKHILTDKEIPTARLQKTTEQWNNFKHRLGDPVMGSYDYKRAMPEGGFRDIAFRKALGFKEPVPYYIPNGDGTYSVNLKLIGKLENRKAIAANNPFATNQLQYATKDPFFGGNGGSVSIDFNPSTMTQTMYDMWSVKPFNMNVNKILGITPFEMRAKIPVKIDTEVPRGILTLKTGEQKPYYPYIVDFDRVYLKNY